MTGRLGLTAHIDFLLDTLEVHRMFNDFIVVSNFLLVNGFTEWPRVLVLGEDLEHFVALLLESALIRLFLLEVRGVVPTGLPQACDLFEGELFL